MCKKAFQERGQFMQSRRVKREISMFWDLQEFSMLAPLGARNEAEVVGRSQIMKSLVYHAKTFFFSKSSIELQNILKQT